jgi:glycosyltransferase involved in cell wall biosynthesis
MKVLLVDPSLYTPPYDGALAGALRDRGHEVKIAGRPLRPTDPPLGDDRIAVEPVFYRRGERLRARRGDGTVVKLAKAAEHAVDLGRLRALVREWQPDVVHWQWPSLPFLDAGAMRTLRAYSPQVATVHDAHVFKQKQGVGRAMSLGWARFLRAADGVIVHVAATRDTIVGLGIPEERIAIVPHGIFARPTTAGAAAPPADGRLHCAFFGRLSADKGIDVLAAAAARLPAEAARRIVLHVCGPVIAGDPRVADAVATLERTPCVQLLPRFVTEAELDTLLASSHLAVFPHREVDASGALMKALGYDVGVLASDVRAFREVLGTSAGVRWFRREDAGDLAAELASLASDPDAVSRMQADVGALRRTALSWAHAAATSESVYRRLLDLRDGPVGATKAGT